MNTATEGVHHQGVILEVGPYPYVGLEDVLEISRERGEPPFVLALDLVHDPRNVGALLRSAEAAGVHGIVIQEKRAGEITPAVVTTSAGASEHLRVARVVNLGRALKDGRVGDEISLRLPVMTRRVRILELLTVHQIESVNSEQ